MPLGNSNALWSILELGAESLTAQENAAFESCQQPFLLRQPVVEKLLSVFELSHWSHWHSDILTFASSCLSLGLSDTAARQLDDL